MNLIGSVGRIFYRTMLIGVFAITAANAVEAKLPGTDLNILLVGVVIGVLGAFLSEAHVLNRYIK